MNNLVGAYLEVSTDNSANWINIGIIVAVARVDSAWKFLLIDQTNELSQFTWTSQRIRVSKLRWRVV